MPHTADAAHAAVVHESYDAARSQKAQCEAASDNPETGDTTIIGEEESALAIWGRRLRARN